MMNEESNDFIRNSCLFVNSKIPIVWMSFCNKKTRKYKCFWIPKEIYDSIPHYPPPSLAEYEKFIRNKGLSAPNSPTNIDIYQLQALANKAILEHYGKDTVEIKLMLKF